MKYVLAKDLPFAKAGSEIIINCGGGASLGGDLYAFGKDGIISKPIERLYIGDIDELVVSGWVKEVKPREYTLGLNKDGTFAFIWDSEGRGYDAQRQYPTAEKIKVREVLE